MSRVLFVVLGEKGHVHPFLGPARELARGGVEVLFWAPSDVSAAIARAGFSFVGPRGAAPPEAARGAAFAALVADPARLRAWIRAMLIEAVPGAVEALDETVAELRPDAIVLDPMAYFAAIVAERRGVPYLGLSTSLNPVLCELPATPLGDTIRDLAADREALLARWGLRATFRVCDLLAPRGTGCFTTEALVGEAPPGVSLLGPSLPEGPRGDEPALDLAAALDGRPFVLMSLGSQIWHQPRMFEIAIEATRGLDVALVAAVGDLALGTLPPHVLAVPYVPQIAALARARAFITHCGANAIMEALAAGVPMLATPICNDQHHNAALLARAGVAAPLDLGRASVGELRAALRGLLEDGPARGAAARLAASYRARSGARGAAALIRARALGGGGG